MKKLGNKAVERILEVISDSELEEGNVDMWKYMNYKSEIFEGNGGETIKDRFLNEIQTILKKEAETELFQNMLDNSSNFMTLESKCELSQIEFKEETDKKVKYNHMTAFKKKNVKPI